MSKIKDTTNLLEYVDASLKRTMKRTLITRIMLADHFLDMIRNNQNVLPRVSKWQDVYECYVARIKISGCSLRKRLDDFHGQCWSFRKEESELLWNARNKEGRRYKNDVVMIETTVYDLVQSVVGIANDPNSIGGLIRIGAVDYNGVRHPTNEDVFVDTSSDAAMMDLLFRKREEFKDEDELRIVFNLFGKIPHRYLRYSQKKGLLMYELSNKDMIKRVICHPLMRKGRVKQIQTAVKKSGWQITKVDRSQLYDLPQEMFKIF